MSSHDENIDIRTRLIGARAVAAESAMVGKSVDDMGKKIDRAGKHMETGSRRGFIYNQALFTVRRSIYATTIALAGMAAAVAAIGFQYNMSMEQNQVALSYLIGSETAARKELGVLYGLAAKTPFEFGNITDAARRFLAFGFTVDETNKFLGVTADAIAAMGGSSDLINRVVLAFGQMQSKGRVMGGELLQLTEAGIPAYKFLQEQLGLTAEQMRKIGLLGIPAKVAIEAITTGMAQQFGGASLKLSKTVTGQLSTMRDYSKQLFGEIILAPFNAVKNSMPGFLVTLQTATEQMRANGFVAMVRVWDDAVGAGGKLTSVVMNMIVLGRGLANTWGTVIWPVIKPFVQLLGVALYGALVLVAHVTDLFGKYGWALVPVLQVLIGLWLIGAIRLKTLVFWEALSVRWTRIQTRESKILVGWTTLQNLWTNRLMLTTKAYVIVQTAMTVGMARMAAASVAVRAALAAVTIGTWLWAAALWATGIPEIVIGITILIIALVALVKYWDNVTRAVGYAWNKLRDFGGWIKSHWYLFGAVGWGAKAASIGKRFIPGLAEGGMITRGGLTVVGERGPEILNLPGAARVQPLPLHDDVRSISRPVELPPLTLHADLIVDGKKFGSVIAEYRQDRVARA